MASILTTTKKRIRIKSNGGNISIHFYIKNTLKNNN
jgi:hypothetical protein